MIFVSENRHIIQHIERVFDNAVHPNQTLVPGRPRVNPLYRMLLSLAARR